MIAQTAPSKEFQLLRSLADARAEARSLRGKLSRQNRYSKIVRRAVVDGHELMIDAFSADPTSRRAKLDQGMSDRRWRWAVSFLKYAGLVPTRHDDWRYGLSWLVDDLGQAVALVERSADELMSSDGYKRLLTISRRRRARH